MADTPVMNWKGRVGFGAASPVTKQIEVLNFGLGADGSIVRNAGMRGTRSEFAAGSTDGLIQCQGPVSLEGRADVLAVLLPAILGGTPSGTSYPLAEALAGYVWHVDEDSELYEFQNVYVNSATFRSSPGQPLQVQLNLLGKTYSSGTAFPSIGASLSTQEPFMHHGLVTSLNAVTYKPEMVQITIDNQLQPLFRVSQTAQHIVSRGRIITVQAQFGFSVDEKVLWGLSTAGFPGSFTWSAQASALSLAMTFPKLQTAFSSPRLPNRATEISRTFSWVARASSAAGDELAVTLDSTP